MKSLFRSDSFSCWLLVFLPSLPRAEFRAGAAVVDVTPPQLPVLVNGGMLSAHARTR